MAQLSFRKYFFPLLLFSIVIAALVVAFQIFFPQYASPALPYILVFFFVITFLTLYIVLPSNRKKKAGAFMSGYMFSRLIKFLSCLLFLFLYIYLNESDSIRFAISFIIIYFAYSGLEIFLLRKGTEENDDQASTTNH